MMTCSAVRHSKRKYVSLIRIIFIDKFTILRESLRECAEVRITMLDLGEKEF
mgnify:CR=1 FL=1